jgi:hypothetical protein
LPSHVTGSGSPVASQSTRKTLKPNGRARPADGLPLRSRCCIRLPGRGSDSFAMPRCPTRSGALAYASKEQRREVWPGSSLRLADRAMRQREARAGIIRKVSGRGHGGWRRRRTHSARCRRLSIGAAEPRRIA